MDDKFTYGLADNMMDSMAVRRILSLKLAGQCTSADFWNSADEDYFFYCKLNMIGDDEDFRLLPLAEYLTAIPCGEEGYDAFERYVREQYGISAAQWRYDIFVRAAGKYIDGYTPAQLGRIKKFFENRNLPEYDCLNADEIAAGIFRLRHKVEASLPENRGYAAFSGMWYDIFDDLSDELPQKKRVSAKELLALAPDPAPLSAEQLGFVISVKERIEKLL